MNNKMTLKGSSVYISHDRTKRERDIQRSVMNYVNEIKNLGKKVRYGFDWCIVDGVKKEWKEGKGLVELNTQRYSSSPSKHHNDRRSDFFRNSPTY